MTLAEIVITQPALKAVWHHVASQAETSVFGLLLGHPRHDPTCARPWAQVTAVQRGPAIAGEPSAATLTQILEHMSGGHDQLAESVLGWYRSHPGAGLYLSPAEAEFHGERFRDPRGFSLILVGDAGRFTGALFQRTEPEGLSRSVYTPFYELVDPSSEFHGTTRRTFVGWPNYQTEARVVQAGAGSVSAQIPRGENAEVTPVAPSPEGEAAPPSSRPTAPRERAPAARQRTPAGGATAKGPAASKPAAGPRPRDGGPRRSGGDMEVDWEKKQIQRSLMAVGRSIGPTALGELDTPVPIDASEKTSPSRARGSAGSEASDADAAGGSPEEGQREGTARSARWPRDRVVIPIRSAPSRTPIAEPGLVGRSRRRKRIPVAKVASAAAGIALVAASGWVGTRMLADRDPAPGTADGSGSPDRASAVAGVGLAPTELFRDPSGQAVFDTPSDEADDSIASEGDPGPAGSASGEAGAASGEAGAPVEAVNGEPVFSNREPEAGPTAPPTASGAREVEVVAPPELGDLGLRDPIIAAYTNALGIFRQEVDRYDSLRSEFDDGTGTCNPLNLALRGVRDSYGRLQRRYETAAESLAAPELRTFEGTGRRLAMVETHYSLTDCPLPPG